MKKVLIITSSLRENSNSNVLAERFMEGAKGASNEVEIISLKNNIIAACLGCNYCQIHGECIMKDKLNEILDKVIESDVLVFASPTYFYSISGTLKNFIDRSYAKFTKIKNKDFYYIGTSADASRDTINRCIETIKGFLDCVDNVSLKGIIYGTGLIDVGDAKYSEAYNEAYELGKNI